jgi:Domain of unknown function (DUF4376)
VIYLIYEKKTGRVVSSVTGESAPAVLSHHDFIEVEAKPDFNTVRVVDGALIDDVAEGYLEGLRAKLRQQIDDARDAAVAQGAVTPHGLFQADLQSRTNINGAVNMAILAGDSFAIQWRTADNSSVSLDQEGMIQVGVMVGQFVSSIYQQSWTMKAQVDALTTVAELKAFTVHFDG